MGLKAENPSQMTDMILKILEDAVVYHPDIICLLKFSQHHLSN
jgi:hypothetical protein